MAATAFALTETLMFGAAPWGGRKMLSQSFQFVGGAYQPLNTLDLIFLTSARVKQL